MMPHGYSHRAFIVSLILLIGAIGYFDHAIGFGFHLFPLYLLPLALVAWKESLRTTLSFSLFAGAIIAGKVFLTRELYVNSFYWYWDAFVKFSLLQIMSYGLWSIRYLTLMQQKSKDARISELNASLQTQVQQLTASNRELEAFSYTMSHDLRAPIRHILGFVNLLNSRDLSSLDQKSRHYLQVITEAAQKMGHLIDGLLVYSQLGRTELRKTRVDLDRLVRDVAQKLAGNIEGREIVWNLAALPSVVADAAMLRQVMVHLIGNALKFSQTRSPALIEVGALERGEETLVYVRDNGAGFDSRYVNKLFGMFQRLHSAEEFDGTGVGLAIVQRIVLRHGGRVWAEGEVDGGATFWFSLPKG